MIPKLQPQQISQSTSNQIKPKIEVGNLLKDDKNDLKIVTKVDELRLVQSVMITYDFKDGFGLTEGVQVEEDIKDEVIKIEAGQEFFNGNDDIIVNKVIESYVNPSFSIIEYTKGKIPYKEKILEFGSYLVRYEYQLIKSVSTITTTQTSNIISLQMYDLYSRNADGKLFRVIYSYNGLTNIHDTDRIQLEAYDSIAQKFIITYFTFKEFKDNIENNKFTYIGRVKKGDSFINEEFNTERKVLGFEYPDDVEYELNDILTTPPTLVKSGYVENLQIFTTSLLQQKYKFNYRLNTAQTPQPQIATIPKQYDTELDALKQKLSDLLFLKSILSDLDFEQKVNVSTEIFDVQYQIDVINGKIFEQKVNESDFFDNLFEQSFTPLKNRYDLDIMKNQIEEIISPSGEMSDFTEDMQNIINSNEFKNWFGDWRNAFFYRNLEDFGGLNISKVLNDKFEPQLVWHGTNNEFGYFKFDLFPANYFAVNKEYSEFFATNKGGQGLVLPFFLNIKNPLDFSHFGINSVTQEQFFDWIYLTVGMTPEELEVNPMFLDANIPPQPVWMFIRNNPTMLKKIADAKVYDGIKFFEFNPNEKNNPDRKAFETLAYIVFDAHQIKLADPNRGSILLANLKSFMLKKGGKI
jgi:hypothetical protein